MRGGDSMPKKPIEHYEHPDTLPNNPTQELIGRLALENVKLEYKV